MPHDADLVRSLRELLAPEPGLTEKTMFGGVAFFLDGNMAVCASGQGGLMVRVNAGEFETLLSRSGVEPVEMRGRAMKGWVRVDPTHLRSAKQLRTWVSRGVATARALPPKR